MGICDGITVGSADGDVDGDCDGYDDGLKEGAKVGYFVHVEQSTGQRSPTLCPAFTVVFSQSCVSNKSQPEGSDPRLSQNVDGDVVGFDEGIAVGKTVGDWEGYDVGKAVGECEHSSLYVSRH